MAIASELGQRKPGIVFAPALGKLAVEQERQREIPARMREVGPERKRLPVCINSGENIVSRLQGKAEIVPGDGMVGLERERRAIRGDGVGLAVGGGQRESQVVVELGLARLRGDGALEQRQCGGELAALIVDHAEKVLRQCVVRLACKHVAICRFGRRHIAGRAALMQRERLLQPLIGGSRCSNRSARGAVTMLVALAAAAWARVVPAGRWSGRGISGG